VRPSQVSLGENIDVDRISASYDNGVLSVILPVAERSETAAHRSSP
jgi:HSP20 family protein